MTDCFIWEYSIKLKAWGLKAHRAGSNAQTLAVLLHPLYVLHHFPLSKPPYILANMLGLSRAAKMGAVAAGAKGLRGFIIIGFRHLTTGNALKCILSQSKGNNQQNFCSQVASFCSFVPGPQKYPGGPRTRSIVQTVGTLGTSRKVIHVCCNCLWV